MLRLPIPLLCARGLPRPSRPRRRGTQRLLHSPPLLQGACLLCFPNGGRYVFFRFLVAIDSINIICFCLQLEGSPLVEAQNDKFSGKGGFYFFGKTKGGSVLLMLFQLLYWMLSRLHRP
jgi:hypothetical protein